MLGHLCKYAHSHMAFCTPDPDSDPEPDPDPDALRHRIPEVPYRAVRVLCWDSFQKWPNIAKYIFIFSNLFSGISGYLGNMVMWRMVV